MAQYIDKSALVAEIEKMLQEEYPCDNLEQTTGYHCALYELQNFLDTLEVKEMDLGKESELIANGIMISVQANKYGTNIYNTKRNDFNHYHLQMAAREGIELGLKAQKGE